MAEVITLSSDDEDASAKGIPLKRKIQNDSPQGVKQAKLNNGVERKIVTPVPDVEFKNEAPSPTVKEKSVSHGNNVSAQTTPPKKQVEAKNGISPSCSTSRLANTFSPVASTSSAEPASVLDNAEGTKKHIDLVHLTPTKNPEFGANLNKTPPLLVVKKIEPVKEDSEQSVFAKFLEACQRKDSDESMQRILNKVQKKFNKLDADEQAGLSDLLVQKVNEINRRDPKVYLHIEAVNNAIKMLLRKEKKAEMEVKEVEEPEEEKQDKKQGKQKSFEQIALERGRRKKIRLIEKAMAECEEKIRELAEEEVNFEDDENSSYMKYERYKRRQVELYNELCKYTKESGDAGREYLKPRNFSSVTCLPQVNEAITSFINSAITKRNNLLKRGCLPDVVLFPDHIDILKCIKQCNTEKNLGLDDRFIQSIAEKAFKDVGTKLQRLRREDYWDTFSIYLETADEDPALNDKELAEKLKINKELGDKKLNDMFDEFAKRQEGLGEVPDEDDASNVESENDEDEDEENEDDAELNGIGSLPDVSVKEKTKEQIKEKEENETHVDKDLCRNDEERGPELSGPSVQENVESAKVSSNLVSETPTVLESRTSPSVSKSKDDHSEPQQNVDPISKDSKNQSAAILTEKSDDASADKTKDEGRSLIRVRSFAKPPSSWTDKSPEKSTEPARVPSPQKTDPDAPEIIECKVSENKLCRKIVGPTVILKHANGTLIVNSNSGNMTTTSNLRTNSGSSKSGQPVGTIRLVPNPVNNIKTTLRPVSLNPGTSNTMILKVTGPNGAPTVSTFKTFAVPEKKLIRKDQGTSNANPKIKIINAPPRAPVIARVIPNVQRPRPQPAASLPLSTLPSNVPKIGPKQKGTAEPQQTKQQE